MNTAGKSQAGNAVQFDVFVVDAVVSNTDKDLKITDTFNDGEISIAVRPQHPDQLVMTSFAERWGTRAPLWLSRNRANTWTTALTINPPPQLTARPAFP